MVLTLEMKSIELLNGFLGKLCYGMRLTNKILVTHLPRQAARIADYVALLYMGKVIEYRPTKEVFNNPRNPLTREFLDHF